MTRIDSTRLKWRVETKTISTGRWIKRWLYETRSVARQVAANYRGQVGFGRTRVVRHISGKGRA